MRRGPEGVISPRAAEASQRDRQLVEAMMEALLQCSGEVGYRQATAEQVYERFDQGRDRFYEHFRDQGHCFVTAYRWKADQLRREIEALLLEEALPEQRTRRVLDALADLATSEEALAKALLVEVHFAGAKAMAARKELCSRLSAAVERAFPSARARRSTGVTTAEFLVGAVDQALSVALTVGDPGDFARAVPELVAVITPYLAPDAST